MSKTINAYPRLAQDGMMTFIPGNGASQLISLDIEYTTLGIPASEVIYSALKTSPHTSNPAPQQPKAISPPPWQRWVALPSKTWPTVASSGTAPKAPR